MFKFLYLKLVGSSVNNYCKDWSKEHLKKEEAYHEYQYVTGEW